MSSQLIDHFRLERELGTGKLGTVYLAVNKDDNSQVALKRFHPYLSQNTQFRDRFIALSYAIEKLKHPNIVPILHYGYAPEATYLAMAYIPGNLRNQLATIRQQGQTYAIEQAVTMTAQMTDGLQYAHSRKLIHLDLKTSNILLGNTADSTRQTPLISDFGLTTLAEGLRGSKSLQFTNTYAYLSPEQVRGERVDGRADIYSLGVILYELVTGRVPFVPRSINEAVNFHTRGTIPRPTALRPDIPPELERLMLKALARKPNERFQSMSALMGVLRQYQSGGLSAIRTVPEPAPRQHKTQYASEPAASLQVPRIERPPVQQEDVGRARLSYGKENETPEFFWLDKNVTNIGRDSANR